VNLANELCKMTYSKFSVKSFLVKLFSDYLSDLTTHSQHQEGCGVCVLADMKKPSRRGPGQLVLDILV